MKRTWNVKNLIAGSVAVATLLVYLPALRNGFVAWDDGPYVAENDHIRTLGASLFTWAFSTFYACNWHPLTWISHALDYAVWGLNPAGHHLTNIILHAVNTFLVVVLAIVLLEAFRERAGPNHSRFFLNDRAILIAGGTTGLLFGLHPLHVESVAWIAERKDLLCALFFLSSLIMYSSYVRGQGSEVRSQKSAVRRRGLQNGSSEIAVYKDFIINKRYLITLGLFILALLSKPMAVTLPIVLLILDWHPFGRLASGKKVWSVFTEKLPFMALACASSIVTVVAQKAGGALSAIDALPLSTRMSVAAESLTAYLAKMLWPLNLVPFYPYPKDASFVSAYYLAAAVLIIGITAACILMVKKQRIWLSAWGYYVVTLAPVLGLVQVGSQSMADRYTYLPSLSPFLIFGLAAAWAEESVITVNKRGLLVKVLSAAVAILGIILLSSLTIAQIRVWKDSYTLWNYVIERDPQGIPSAYNGRALAFEERGLYNEALADYQKAVDLSPSYTEAYINRGSLLVKLNRVDLAIADYNHAIALNPARYEAYFNLGLLYGRTGFTGRAIEYFSKVIEINPGYAEAYKNRGLSYFYASRYESALEDFNKAIALSHNPSSVYVHRGNLYLKAGNKELAVADFQKACGLGEKMGCSELQVLQQ